MRIKNNFEEKIISESILNKAYKKAKKEILDNSVKMENFADLYGKNAVDKDIEYVKKMEGILIIKNITLILKKMFTNMQLYLKLLWMNR